MYIQQMVELPGQEMGMVFLGGNYLDYSVLAHDPVHGQHLGIMLIEFGVGTTVASAMITIFFIFAGQDPEIGRGER